jgi:hypothetical protein
MKTIISALAIGALLISGSAAFANKKSAPRKASFAKKQLRSSGKKGDGWYNGSYQTTGWHNSISAGSNGYLQTPGYFQAR